MKKTNKKTDGFFKRNKKGLLFLGGSAAGIAAAAAFPVPAITFTLIRAAYWIGFYELATSNSKSD
jgi:hypothetical protein